MTRSVRCEMRKWPDAPHWEFDCLWLGADAVGQWLGLRSGTWMSRPGAGMHATADHVVLVPHDDWWVATFYDDDPDRPFDTYVDITTPASWDGDVVRAIDLDLDVIRGTTGRVWVDDEDEFAAHRVSLAYPEDIVAGALSSCERVLPAVTSDSAPYARSVAFGWIAKLRSIAETPKNDAPER